MSDPPGDESRYQRERAFHDERFTSDDERGSTEKYYATSAESYERYTSLLDNQAGPGKRVLEYGCGAGSRAFELARRGAEVVGIDISPVAIARAQGKAEAEGINGLQFRVMNAEAVDFPDETFDLVCGSAILHHLDLSRSLPEVRRVLKAGGGVVFYEPLGHNPLINAYRAATPRMRTPDEHPLRVSDLAELRKHFQDSHVEYFHLLSLAAALLWRRPAFALVLSALLTIDRAIFRAIPASRRYAWVAICMGTKGSTSLSGSGRS